MSPRVYPAVSKIRLQAAFETIEGAALLGQRCPMNEDLPKGAMALLAHGGKIRVFIYGRNFRMVEILSGPHKGTRTAAPTDGRLLWRVVDVKRARRPSAEELAAWGWAA